MLQRGQTHVMMRVDKTWAHDVVRGPDDPDIWVVFANDGERADRKNTATGHDDRGVIDHDGNAAVVNLADRGFAANDHRG